MKIIEPPNQNLLTPTWKKRCPTCECLFSYVRGDVYTSQDQRDPGEFIDCPGCKRMLNADGKRTSHADA